MYKSDDNLFTNVVTWSKDDIDAEDNIRKLWKRVLVFLEEKEWYEADEYCERILDENLECAEAYLGKLMVNLGVNDPYLLSEYPTSFETNKNYIKAMRYGSHLLREKLTNDINCINSRRQIIIDKLCDLNVGDKLNYGKYYDGSKNSEGQNIINDVKWLVLDKKGDTALVITDLGISSYIFNQHQFDSTDGSEITWRNCCLRSIMDNLYEKMFSTTEKTFILLSDNIVYKHSLTWGAYDMGIVKDKLFLLSVKEVEKYFTIDNQDCEVSNYVKEFIPNPNDKHGWFTRDVCVWTKKDQGPVTVYSKKEGKKNTRFAMYKSFNVIAVIRPAMWIKLK